MKILKFAAIAVMAFSTLLAGCNDSSSGFSPPPPPPTLTWDQADWDEARWQ
jgi:hypothetical protein